MYLVALLLGRSAHTDRRRVPIRFRPTWSLTVREKRVNSYLMEVSSCEKESGSL